MKKLKLLTTKIPNLNPKMKIKNLNCTRTDWVLPKLDQFKYQLKSTIVSDLVSGWGWFKHHILERNFTWQPLIDKSIIWDFNNATPEDVIQLDLLLFSKGSYILFNPNT